MSWRAGELDAGVSMQGRRPGRAKAVGSQQGRLEQERAGALRLGDGVDCDVDESRRCCIIVAVLVLLILVLLCRRGDWRPLGGESRKLDGELLHEGEAQKGRARPAD